MNTKINILLIEDEKNICDFIATALTAQNYRVTCAGNGTEGLSLAASFCPDIVLLDLGLPDMDGLDIITRIRSWSAMPIIVISARTREDAKVRALDLGADDYITKPFGTPELLARIRTALRHSSRGTGTGAAPLIYHAKNLKIDFERRLVTVNGQEIHLTQIEYKILSLLAQNSGRVITYDAIMSAVWGPYSDGNNRILRVNMANIRRKLEANPAAPEYLFTEVGIGYRMLEDESW
ncbi:MAG: response regulator transcription factor [Candidatus Limivivens sp.]|nr:response regulator transcription factor [Candidatus Limivivens sp.]